MEEEEGQEATGLELSPMTIELSCFVVLWSLRLHAVLSLIFKQYCNPQGTILGCGTGGQEQRSGGKKEVL
jgi:hypothetical protein